MIVMGMLVTGVLVVALAAALVLRRWTLDEARTEARLHQPGAHRLAYVVPDGQDPAVLTAALAHAHFASVTDLEGGRERLLVAAEEGDRARVRSILEQVDRAGLDGPEMHVGHVSFEDER
jgi:hypothetical protein